MLVFFDSDSDNYGLMSVMLSFSQESTAPASLGTGSAATGVGVGAAPCAPVAAPPEYYYMHHKNDLSVHSSNAHDGRFQLVVMEYNPEGTSPKDRWRDMCVGKV